MTYPAINVARYTLSYCTEQGQPISNLKLQKMLYFMWIDFYRETEKELYTDEICAWQLGPVVPEVYYEFCSYAGTPIVMTTTPEIDETDKIVINRIIDKYIKVAASALVNRTHASNKPWSYIYQDGTGLRDIIPFTLIKDMEC